MMKMTESYQNFLFVLLCPQTGRQQRTRGSLVSVTLHHTHTHSLSVMRPITTPLPAPVFPFFLSPFLPLFSSVFFSRAHDALWHNETVKRSPVEAGAETKRGCGWV